jgi:hypothetical protein
MVGDLLWLCGLIPHPALAGVKKETRRSKTKSNTSKSVNAISHPDQWGLGV